MSRQISDLDPIDAAELEISDLMAVEDIDVPRTKKVTLAELAQKINDIQTPLGSLYYNADDDTNPNLLLGFGTWEVFGKGRVAVGASDTDGDFATGGQQGGSKSVTLSVDQMPQHNHPGSTSGVGDHNHGTAGDPVFTSAGGNQRAAVGGSGQQFRWSVGGNLPAGGHSHSVATDNRGGNQAHTNLQPYVVVYIWKRTG